MSIDEADQAPVSFVWRRSRVNSWVSGVIILVQYFSPIEVAIWNKTIVFFFFRFIVIGRAIEYSTLALVARHGCAV